MGALPGKCISASSSRRLARHQIQPHGPLCLRPDLGGGHTFSVEAENPGAAPAVRRKGTGQEHRHQSRQGLGPIPVIPSCQPLDQSHSLFEPQFLHLQNGVIKPQTPLRWAARTGRDGGT